MSRNLFIRSELPLCRAGPKIAPLCSKRTKNHARRAEIGQHHRIGVHLHQYAGEMAWREDNRRKPNGTLFMNAAGAALAAR
jgi:hypothetical protein